MWTPAVVFVCLVLSVGEQCTGVCMCESVCVCVCTRGQCYIVLEPCGWDGANTWMNLSLQTHCFFSSSDYTAPKHTEQFLGGALYMCVCVSVCVKQGEECVTCALPVCKCLWVWERQEQIARVTERCVSECTCLNYCCVLGFTQENMKQGYYCVLRGLIMSHFEEYTHEHAYIGDGRQWQYSKIQRHQNVNSSEKQRIAPEYFICRKH